MKRRGAVAVLVAVVGVGVLRAFRRVRAEPRLMQLRASVAKDMLTGWVGGS